MSDPVAVLVPQLNPNDDRAVVVAWHVPSGSWVDTAARIATLETTKTAFDVDAPAAGYVTYSAPEKAVVDVGGVVAWIHEELPGPDQTSKLVASAGSNASAAASDSAPTPTEADAAGPDDMRTASGRFTRKALRRLRELGLKMEDFTGEGRVDITEVERRARTMAAHTKQAIIDIRRVSPGSPQGVPSDTEAVPLEQSPSKVLEAAMLAETYRNIVPSMVTVTCDAGRIEDRLRQLVTSCPVSLLELVIHEAARALEAFPELNGFVADGRAYTYRAVHVGFAVNAGRSLKVPVVRDANTLSQLAIAQRVRDLTLRYMRNELTMGDLAWGTFTVTDLSLHGVVHFVPVLSARQSAILGVCAERFEMRQRDLVLAFDHRMSDGMRAAAFLGELRKRLEA